MDFNQKLKSIIKELQQVEQETKSLQGTSELHKIDIHRLLDKVRNIYDHFLEIDHQEPSIRKTEKATQQPKEQELPKEKTHREDYQESEEEKENTREEEKLTGEEETGKTQEEENNPPLIIENENIQKQREKEQKDKENKPKDNASQKSSNGGIVADKFQNTQTYRHDDLSKKQTKQDLSSRMQKKPIYDLTKAIGINDKFSFIRELFDGDKEQFHESVQIINELPNYEEAQKYIAESFNWNEEDPEVQKFMELVERKFASNK